MSARDLAYVGLGANLGDAVASLQQAQQWLRESPGVALVARSGLYRSAPVDAQGPDFVNAVVALTTSMGPWALLDLLQVLEQRAGRERPYHHAPRTLDLDLLLYGDIRIDEPRLTLPHPRLLERAFVMLPLAEIAPRFGLAAAAPALRAQRIERLP